MSSELLPPRRGILFIVSAPSGAGKTSIARGALDAFPELELSISCTTRAPRTGERRGIDYHFLSPEEFERRRAAGAFAESARVHDFSYGTPKAPIEKARAERRDVLLDIDVQGARQIRVVYPDSVSVFVLPPSETELERRLRARRTDAEDVIRRRLERAREEVGDYGRYDYAIVNDDLSRSIRTFCSIVEAERARVSRME